jgi:arginine/lysine/ornithine decarboxylase
LAAGADLVVASAHKTLGSLTQSALLHLHPQALIDRDRLNQVLRWVTSSSPSYLLMASLDAARRRAALRGQVDWGETLARVDRVRSQLAGDRAIRVLSGPIAWWRLWRPWRDRPKWLSIGGWMRSPDCLRPPVRPR